MYLKPRPPDSTAPTAATATRTSTTPDRPDRSTAATSPSPPSATRAGGGIAYKGFNAGSLSVTGTTLHTDPHATAPGGRDPHAVLSHHASR
jgi:hypothetical protein